MSRDPTGVRVAGSLPHLDAAARRAYEARVATHNHPRPWQDLPAYEKHKWRTIARAVIDVHESVRKSRTVRFQKMR